MNAYKNGSLLGVSMRNWIPSYANAESFLNNMKISDQDHEYWYGDRKTADAMPKEQLDRNFHFKLAYLNF